MCRLRCEPRQCGGKLNKSLKKVGLHLLDVMQSQPTPVERLYTEKLSTYGTFISFFRSRDAIRGLFESSELLRPQLRVLDAGAGFGTATFALLEALRGQDIEPQTIDGFDLTPAMLDRF